MLFNDSWWVFSLSGSQPQMAQMQFSYVLKTIMDFSMSTCLIYFLNRAGILLYLIERAKKCLDFSATVYIIHLFICILYGGWPSSITWWVVNGTSLALMALLGEWLCVKRELRDIPLTRIHSSEWFVSL